MWIRWASWLQPHLLLLSVLQWNSRLSDHGLGLSCREWTAVFLLCHAETGSCTANTSLSSWDDSAQTPKVKQVEPLDFGYTSQDHSPNSAVTDNPPLRALEASLSEKAGLPSSQEGVKGQLDPGLFRLRRKGVGGVLPSHNGGKTGRCLQLCRAGGQCGFLHAEVPASCWQDCCEPWSDSQVLPYFCSPFVNN